MPSNHLILCRPLLVLPSILPSIRVFSKESALCIRWPKYWSFRFNISPSNEHSGLVSFRMDWLYLLAVRRTLKSLSFIFFFEITYQDLLESTPAAGFLQSSQGRSYNNLKETFPRRPHSTALCLGWGRGQNPAWLDLLSMAGLGLADRSPVAEALGLLTSCTCPACQPGSWPRTWRRRRAR